MEKYAIKAVPERIAKLKNELYATPTELCFERALIITSSYKKSEGEHQAIRRAKALRDVFNKIPIFIRSNELIVGQRASILAGRSVYPEYHLNNLTKETTPIEVWDYWHGKTIGDITRKTYPERLKLAESEKASGYVTGSDSGFGHVIVDYEKAITCGFHSIINEAEALLADTAEEDIEGRAFLEAAIISSKGIIEWANRYADLAQNEAESELNDNRKKELLHISEICRRVPAKPARNFAEALQSFWFVHIALHIEQHGWSISAGRFDQYMFPFFENDMKSGVISKGVAWELLLNLWLKFIENVNTGIKKEGLFQNLTLGGCDIDGIDQSNELSKMCLDATIALGSSQPALSVRWHPNIDPDFWEYVHLTVAQGTGMPALFNDEIIISTFIANGVSVEDATGYGVVGCVEPCIPGMQQGLTAGGHLNCAKALELALNGGRSMITGTQIGLKTKEPSEFERFDDLWAAYKEQVEYLAGLNVLATHISGEVQKQYGFCPLMSSLLNDCLKKRRDLVYGGTRYNFSGVAIFGPSNTYDSMTAIKKWICEEKRFSWKELQQGLINDFVGYEEMRQLFAKKTPRFGNDITEVDELANKINALHADFFWKQVDSRNGRYTSGVWPVNSHVAAGHWTAATADGRHKGLPLVDGVGACQGADRNGPTALLKSVARLNNRDHWAAGNTCNIKFSALGMKT